MVPPGQDAVDGTPVDIVDGGLANPITAINFNYDNT